MRVSATESLRLSTNDVNARLREETAAAAQTKQAVLDAGDAAVGTATTSAAESGVAGGSVDALVASILRQQTLGVGNVDTNLDMLESQAQRQKRGLQADRRQQVAGAPRPSAVATGLGIAGAGISFLNQLRLNNPPE